MIKKREKKKKNALGPPLHPARWRPLAASASPQAFIGAAVQRFRTTPLKAFNGANVLLYNTKQKRLFPGLKCLTVTIIIIMCVWGGGGGVDICDRRDFTRAWVTGTFLYLIYFDLLIQSLDRKADQSFFFFFLTRAFCIRRNDETKLRNEFTKSLNGKYGDWCGQWAAYCTFFLYFTKWAAGWIQAIIYVRCCCFPDLSHVNIQGVKTHIVGIIKDDTWIFGIII